VLDLAARYEDGESRRALRRELLDENKWRATRHGHDADLIQPDGGTLSLGEAVEREVDRLGVTGLREIYEAESGAHRQRRVLEESGPAALRESISLQPRV
jgi:carboxylate-amine ligase